MKGKLQKIDIFSWKANSQYLVQRQTPNIQLKNNSQYSVKKQTPNIKLKEKLPIYSWKENVTP